ncbi:ferrochelatase [Sphingorhabdus sp.]|uniref:ferrochelatase n=1 Tax=Sphingorhabdus sp. TaxID=1902408 RepID=UPI0037C9E769
MTLPINHPPVATPKIGVLLVNLGTPDAPTTSAVKRYLKQFLSDRRVVEIPPIIWQPILRGIILNTRPQKSAKAYAKVWTDKGSPLAFFTAGQADVLQARMGESADVRYAMRYGNPSVADQLSVMKTAGCNRILIAPMYPQYSGATTGTVLDEAYATLTAMRWHPAIRTLPAYHDDAAYIGSLKTSIEASLAGLDFEPDAIVISFHGMPERTLQLGDPYHCHCQKTARLLSEAMGRELVVSFQSRFGRAKWLEPATDDTLMRLAREGTKKVAIFAPGFSVDCLETLEELAMQGHEQFEEAGGTHYAYMPCLNDSDVGMDMVERIIRRELAGWI